MRLLSLMLLGVVLMVGFALTSSSASVRGVVRVTAVVTDSNQRWGRTVTVQQLRSPRGHVIGWSDTVCFNLGNGSSQCGGTFILPRGKLNVAGTRRNDSYFVLAITGGTGIYSGAGG